METYILDSLLRRVDVVDDYLSLIWTERFADIGDFEMTINSTLKNRRRLTEGTRLAMSDSYRIMTITSFEDKTAEDGSTVLTVKGKSLEQILDNRLARGDFSSTAGNPKWIITDTPVNIAKKIFHDICVTGIISVSDIIPFIHEGSTIFPTDTLPAPTSVISYEMDPMTVYSAIKQICDMYDMGFRLFRNQESSQLWFDIYMGSDRTSGQSTRPAVVFSPNLDNLKNVRELRTTESYKNVAYVMTPVGNAVVYPDNIDASTITGLDRNVLIVEAEDITDSSPSVSLPRIIQRGKEALAANRMFAGFDGEISQFSQYKYQQDYFLGDLVEMRGKDGNVDNMQVTEQIFVDDGEGERSYPTLTLNKFITPGSWAAWPTDEEWSEVTDTTFWANASD